MTIRFSTGLRNSLLDTASMKTALANGIIELRSGSQPATADSAATGTLLAIVTENGGAFTPGSATNGLNYGTAASGSMPKDANDWEYTGIAAGVVGWFRFKGNALDDDLASTTLPRIDGSVAKSGANMNISNVNITIGAPGSITSAPLSIPAQA